MLSNKRRDKNLKSKKTNHTSPPPPIRQTKRPPPNAANHLARLLRPPSSPQGVLTTCLLRGLDANCLLRAVGARRVAKIGPLATGLRVSLAIYLGRQHTHSFLLILSVCQSVFLSCKTHLSVFHLKRQIPFLRFLYHCLLALKMLARKWEITSFRHYPSTHSPPAHQPHPRDVY